MNRTEQVRRLRLQEVINERFNGVGGKLADAIKRPRPNISQVLSGKRPFGEALARDIEKIISLPAGWLDRPADSAALETEPGPDYVPVTRVLLRLSAGATGYHVEQLEGNGPPIYFRRDFIAGKGWKPEKLFALKVTGDSMEPALYEGDLVVVNAADMVPADGEVFAVNYEGQAVIKRLRRDAGEWWLDSDNPRHKPKRCDEHAILIGRVVYKQSEKI